MPEIHIPDDLYERLGRWAKPFETPADVIRRLLVEKESGQSIRTDRTPEGSSRRLRRDSLRGNVIARWHAQGEPPWEIEETVRVCEEEDEKLQKNGKNPSPRFRSARERRDATYVRTFVYGCHFQWLNPR